MIGKAFTGKNSIRCFLGHHSWRIY